MGDTSHLTLLNEAFFFDAEGKRRGSYVKKNLWHPERSVPSIIARYQAHDAESILILGKIITPSLIRHGVKPAF